MGGGGGGGGGGFSIRGKGLCHILQRRLVSAIPGKEECCKPKCELFSCEAPWAPSVAKKDVVSSAAEDCCDQTCAAVNCSASGWAVNESKALVVGSSVQDCCTPTCSNTAQVTCPTGFAVKPEDVNKTEGCCQKQCKAHKCSDGWTDDDSKADDFADSDEACCVKTCKQFLYPPWDFFIFVYIKPKRILNMFLLWFKGEYRFECPAEDGWAPWESVANDIGNNVTQCCLPTCKQFTCNATEGWLPAPKNGKDNVVGSTSSACCVPACSSYSCSPDKGLMQIPDAAKIPGASDELCCESAKCDRVRKNMTELGKDEYCNSLSADDCEKKFIKYKSKTEVKASNGKVAATAKSTHIVSCTYNTTYQLCRYDTDREIKGGCSGV